MTRLTSDALYGKYAPNYFVKRNTYLQLLSEDKRTIITTCPEGAATRGNKNIEKIFMESPPIFIMEKIRKIF